MARRCGVRARPYRRIAQAGLTMVELMIALTLALLIVLASTALLLSSKAGYSAQDDATRLQESGRYALEIIARAVRQAAYENWDSEEAPMVADASASANIAGWDARGLRDGTAGIAAPLATSVNGSDVLAIRFFGAGTGADGDGTMLNCAGFGVAAPDTAETADEARGWSIFYVAESSGEPELRCKYRGKHSWTSDAIVRGVESFQVLYGVDTDADGASNQFLTADAINALDDALTLAGNNAAARARDKNKKTYWKKVSAVKVALLVRGSENTRADALRTRYDLFGKDYGDAHGLEDRGTRIKEEDMPSGTRNRGRKIFTLTIPLRNHAAGSAA